MLVAGMGIAAVERGAMAVGCARERHGPSTSGPGVYGGKPPGSNWTEAVHGKSVDLAAKAVQVGAGSIARAKRVKDKAPEAYTRLQGGESTVNAEYTKVREIPLRPISALAVAVERGPWFTCWWPALA